MVVSISANIGCVIKHAKISVNRIGNTVYPTGFGILPNSIRAERGDAGGGAAGWSRIKDWHDYTSYMQRPKQAEQFTAFASLPSSAPDVDTPLNLVAELYCGEAAQ